MFDAYEDAVQRFGVHNIHGIPNPWFGRSRNLLSQYPAVTHPREIALLV